MDLKSGYPYFLLKNGLGAGYSRLDGDKKTEVVILGGGISGALMAYELANNNIDCIVLDARGIGMGSTCASTALLLYEIDVPLHRLAEKIGKEKAVKAYKICASAINMLQQAADATGFPAFQRCGSVYFANKKTPDDFLKKEYDARREAGFEVELLDGKKLRAEYFLNAPGAIVSNCAAKTDAYLFTHYLHRYSMQKGASVYENTYVKSISSTADGVELKTDRGYKVQAKKIVYATGYESVEQLSRDIVALQSTYVCAGMPLQNLPGSFKNNVFWETGQAYLYFREDAGRMLLGGADEDFYNSARRDKLLPKKIKKLEAQFKKLCPDIDFETQFAWAGTFGSTDDGLPYIDTHKGYPNSYFALGYGGNGITFSAIAAREIAGMLLNKATAKDIFSFNR